MNSKSAAAGKILQILGNRMPSWLISLEIQILMNATARAFEQHTRQVWFCSSQEALRRYAAFTCKCIESGKGSPETIYRSAYKLGGMIRRITGLDKQDDLQKLVFLLYSGIGIRMDGCLPGEISVASCYFSCHYPPRQCALMSFMDSGVIAGIFGGGELAFSERITEGYDRCRACFFSGLPSGGRQEMAGNADS